MCGVDVRARDCPDLPHHRYRCIRGLRVHLLGDAEPTKADASHGRVSCVHRVDPTLLPNVGRAKEKAAEHDSASGHRQPSAPHGADPSSLLRPHTAAELARIELAQRREERKRLELQLRQQREQWKRQKEFVRVIGWVLDRMRTDEEEDYEAEG